jgi:hypothetical protein
MTIRSYLLLRRFLAQMVGLAVCIVVFLVVFTLVRPTRHRYGIYAIAAAGLALLPMQWWVRARLVRCPRCNASLGSRVSFLQNCPDCGVSLGEEVA